MMQRISFFPRLKFLAAMLAAILPLSFAPARADESGKPPEGPPALPGIAEKGRKPTAPADARSPRDEAGPSPLQSPAGDGLSSQVLYQYLISEIAGQRGRGGLAVEGLTDLARSTHDPRIARRALEVAFQTRQFGNAMQAATLWLELEPDSTLARQAMAVLITNQGSLESATQNLKQLLVDADKAPAIYLQLVGVLNRFPDKQAVLQSTTELVAMHPEIPEAQFALSQAAAQVRDFVQAKQAAEQALTLRADFQSAAIMKGQILRESSETAAADFMKEWLAAHPDAKEARVSYARLLVAQKSYLSAREEFRRAAESAPKDPEIPYAIGLISMQIEDYAGADVAFRRALSLDPRDRNPVLMNLGQLEEARKNLDAAVEWYKQIDEGDYFVSAQLKIANVLAKQEGMASGRKYLQEVETDTTEQRVQLILAEAQLLRDAKAYREAYALLSESLAKYPDTVELLYDRAMVAEKLNRIPDLEKDLRRVIELKPDHAHAYNALGYTLADRTTRFGEAQDLIQKAVALSPEDPFILDSLGWVQFRQKKIGDALDTLKKAFSIRHDPEIAAHLGEVMWASGSHAEAAQLWRASLLEYPGNDSLTSILQKYRP